MVTTRCNITLISSEYLNFKALNLTRKKVYFEQLTAVITTKTSRLHLIG